MCLCVSRRHHQIRFIQDTSSASAFPNNPQSHTFNLPCIVHPGRHNQTSNDYRQTQLVGKKLLIYRSLPHSACPPPTGGLAIIASQVKWDSVVVAGEMAFGTARPTVFHSRFTKVHAAQCARAGLS